MINLVIKPYCENCSYFEPKLSKTETFDKDNNYLNQVDTEIHCKNESKCNKLFNKMVDSTFIKMENAENLNEDVNIPLREILQESNYEM